jgi:5-methylcytosine-specific restriction protein B
MNENCWFVGSVWQPGGEQLDRFRRDGVWEHGFAEGKPQVREMQPGDRIVVKSSYVRKHGLPFDNRGRSVSTMAVKATGTITENEGDGKRVRVSWDTAIEPREWYFHTSRNTIWRIDPDSDFAQQLMAFALNQEEQRIGDFLAHPYWAAMYGPPTFPWIPFYEEFADHLLTYRTRRPELLKILLAAIEESQSPAVITDQFPDNTAGTMRDICPFTLMGMFNRGITSDNRTRLASSLAKGLGLKASPPETFDGIPVLNNQRTWFYGYARVRHEDDIDRLWDIFEAALKLEESDDRSLERFGLAFDRALSVKGVSWNLTMGLYWIRPWQFCPLDQNSREFISKTFGLNSGLDSESYLSLLEELDLRFAEPDAKVKSFPELSHEAWKVVSRAFLTEPDAEPGPTFGEPVTMESTSYTLDDLKKEGCFLSSNKSAEILDQARSKKNIVLQGPPGTGKTWLAKRLGYALLGVRDASRVLSIQFHPSISYEDFVRGYRPEGGKLILEDGPLLEFAARAGQDSDQPYVLVIEEINRGNPAQIFGEALTLLEVDKRCREEALKLCHPRHPEERVHLPSNLFVIGTMNIADRSLAMVDFALRRRFAFIDLEPEIGPIWREWMELHFPKVAPYLTLIEQRLVELNKTISEAKELGPQFRIGHSYVTPPLGASITDPIAWFSRLVRYEIRPLLEEYWFDNAERAREEAARLLQGFEP